MKLVNVQAALAAYGSGTVVAASETWAGGGAGGRTAAESPQRTSSEMDFETLINRRPDHMKMKARLHKKGSKALLESGAIKKKSEFLAKNIGLQECNDKKHKTNDGYDCLQMDQYAFISNAQLGSLAATNYTIDCSNKEETHDKAGFERPCREGFDWISDLWGWESPSSGRKYAIAGLWDGTSFVDITDQRQPEVLGFIDTGGLLPPGNSVDGFWRDFKIVKDVLYVGAETESHGVQIFDLARLDSLERPPKKGKIPERGDVPRLDLDGFFGGVGHSHNIVAFPEQEQILVVGFGSFFGNDAPSGEMACDDTEGDTILVLDVSDDPFDPSTSCLNVASDINAQNLPPFALLHTEPGYVHDMQCIVYKGPDVKYADVPICFIFAETQVGIYDMDKKKFISIFSFYGATYVHQGWVSEDHTALYVNDEVDELCRSGILEGFIDECQTVFGTGDDAFTKTRIFDITSLEDVKEPKTFLNTNAHPAVDHNLYVKGKHIYSASYMAGARIWEIQEDKSLKEVAFFDMNDDCDDILNCDDFFAGTWTHFGYYSDSTSIAGDGYYGLYIFRVRLDDETGKPTRSPTAGGAGAKSAKSKTAKSGKGGKSSKASSVAAREQASHMSLSLREEPSSMSFLFV